MARLSGAYKGYEHQDVLTACALAHIAASDECHSVSSELRRVEDDVFDDLEILDETPRRVQVKAHVAQARQLNLSDLVTDAISFRIDHALRTLVSDPESEFHYRLIVTYEGIADDLAPFLGPSPNSPPLLPRLATERFRLLPDEIWPIDREPVWMVLRGAERSEFVRFCEAFIVEVNCPTASSDFRAPGALESALLSLLRRDVGIGSWPNHTRDAVDVAAQLIRIAQRIRANSETIAREEILRSLALRIDFGRVHEFFPVDETRAISRGTVLDEILNGALDTNRFVVTGPPGIGKSWLLSQAATKLRENGCLVAVHYCFVDLVDTERERRALTETAFGSLIAELIRFDPRLAALHRPRFAGGSPDLERLLRITEELDPDRRVVLIVDGLDHIDRMSQKTHLAGSAEEVALELQGLDLPAKVTVIIGSQPGSHLRVLPGDAWDSYDVPLWADEDVRRLAIHMKIEEILADAGLSDSLGRVLAAICQKAGGNALYATYLTRTAIQILEGPPEQTIHLEDPVDGLTGLPEAGEDLDQYYQWLLDGLRDQTGSQWTAELLALLDFSVSRTELGEIRPDFAHHIDRVLKSLAPVLSDDVGRGGVRIYHESFQRFVRGHLERNGANVAEILAPVILWLDKKSFSRDSRAFRFLFGLLRMSDRWDEVNERIGTDFVAVAIAAAQPGEVVLQNLTLAADGAAEAQDWVSLTRLCELARAADQFYDWRLDDHATAEEYGRAVAALYGPQMLADRLLYDGKCTFPPRAGLILCKLCDDAGVAPPWAEYEKAYQQHRKNDNTVYDADADAAIEIARFIGDLRQQTPSEAIDLCEKLLNDNSNRSIHPLDVGYLLAQIYGTEALEMVLARLPKGPTLAWSRLALAYALEAQGQRDTGTQAARALADGLPPSGWRRALRLGANARRCAPDPEVLVDLTDKVTSSEVQHDAKWLTSWRAHLAVFAVTDPALLLRVEAQLPSETWFQKWLRLCVDLAHLGTTPQMLSQRLLDLSTDVKPFKGDPRVCDLYRLHGEIEESFSEVLSKAIGDEQWAAFARSLADISKATSTWLMGSRSGPIPIDRLLQICVDAADNEARLSAAADLALSILGPDKRGLEFYDVHAGDQMLLARLLHDSGKHDAAENAWLEACQYLAGYGFRKDITIYELLDCLDALAGADPVRVRACLSKVQTYVERVLAHTDGRETRHAIHQWIKSLARYDPAGALLHIAREEASDRYSEGNYGHAVPAAMEQLVGQIDPTLEACGWIVATDEASIMSSQALHSSVRAKEQAADVGTRLWHMQLAILAGDVVAFPDSLVECAERSAQEASLAPVALEGEHRQDTDRESDGRRPENTSELPSLTGFPSQTVIFSVDSSPARLLHDLRRCRNQPESFGMDAVVNALGYRLVGYYQDGQIDLVRAILHRVAQDTQPWQRDGLLFDLAQGLAMRGQAELAAIAAAYAYTRTTDGWRRFGGSKHQGKFEFSLSLAQGATWDTLAREVANNVSARGALGTTTHLIELLASFGKADDAFAAWDAACEIIGQRLPCTGQRDKLWVVYKPQAIQMSTAVAAFVLNRTSHYCLYRKRLALAMSALVLQQEPIAFADAVRVAVDHGALRSSVFVLLKVLDDFEEPPYRATQALCDVLRTLAESPWAGTRWVAGNLLRRSGIEVRPPAPVEQELVSRLPRDKYIEIIEGIGPDRLRGMAEIWKDFPIEFATRLHQRLDSPTHKDAMQRAVQRIGLTRRDGRSCKFWLPLNEDIMDVLQETAAMARVALAREGILDAGIEERVGTALDRSLELPIRIAFSRTVRPPFTPPADLPDDFAEISDDPPIVGGEYEGWYIAGILEKEAILGDQYGKPVVARKTVSKGLFYAAWPPAQGQLPFVVGDSDNWILDRTKRIDGKGPIHGLCGLDISWDFIDTYEVLTPHPALRIIGKLHPAPFTLGLMLVDKDLQPAIIARNWRSWLMGTDPLVDQEPRREGQVLLIRPDLLEAMNKYAASQPRMYAVTSVEATEVPH